MTIKTFAWSSSPRISNQIKRYLETCDKYREEIEDFTSRMKDTLTKPDKKGLLYISGPIRGIDNYRENFAIAEERMTFDGWSVINPAKIADSLPELTHEQYMHIDYSLLDLCDGVYFLRGSDKSEGAYLEWLYSLANKIEQKRMYEDDSVQEKMWNRHITEFKKNIKEKE